MYVYIYIYIYISVSLYIYIYIYIYISQRLGEGVRPFASRKVAACVDRCKEITTHPLCTPSAPTKSFDFRGFDSSKL